MIADGIHETKKESPIVKHHRWTIFLPITMVIFINYNGAWKFGPSSKHLTLPTYWELYTENYIHSSYEDVVQDLIVNWHILKNIWDFNTTSQWANRMSKQSIFSEKQFSCHLTVLYTKLSAFQHQNPRFDNYLSCWANKICHDKRMFTKLCRLLIKQLSLLKHYLLVYWNFFLLHISDKKHQTEW